MLPRVSIIRSNVLSLSLSSSSLCLFVVIIFLLPLLHNTGIGYAATNVKATCTELQATLDEFVSTDDILNYLRFNIPDQETYIELFQCMGSITSSNNGGGEQQQPQQQRLPTDLLSIVPYTTGTTTLATKTAAAAAAAAVDYIFADGWTVQYSNRRVGDRIRSRLINRIWDGKIFKKSTTGTANSTTGSSSNSSSSSSVDDVWNIVPFAHSLSFTANSYSTKNIPCIIDGNTNCLIVDYRTSDRSVATIGRDDLREVIVKNGTTLTQIYIGIGYLFNGTTTSTDDTNWINPSNWMYGISFLLDIRTEIQTKIPSWIQRRPCCT